MPCKSGIVYRPRRASQSLDPTYKNWTCTTPPVRRTIRAIGPGRPRITARMSRYALPSFIALAVGWAFWPTFDFLFGKWSDDPQYSHGFLVPLFAAYLLYKNREALMPALNGPGWPILGGALLT